MASLDTWPIDILSLLTKYLNAYDIGFLWLCGNSQLNQKLKTCVLVWHMEWRTARKAFFPKLVSNFSNLEDITLVLSEFNPVLNMDPFDLKLISPTVKIIDFDCAKSFEFFETWTSMGPVSDHSPPKKIAKTIFPIKSYFKNLEVLRLRQTNRLITYHMFDDWFLFLPHSLKILHVCCNSVLSPAFIEYLPRGLVEATILISIQANKLGGFGSFGGSSTMNKTGFPASLKKLVLSEVSGINIFEMLPEGLEEFQIQTTPGYIKPLHWKYLPRSLTSFANGPGERSHHPEIDHSVLSDLPPGLKILWLSNAIRLSDSDFALLPRQLEFLSSGSSLQLQSPEAYKNMPPTLKKVLSLVIFSNMIPYVPKSFTTMMLIGFKMTEQNFRDLPPKLESLHIDNLSAETVELLPSTLTFLRIQSGRGDVLTKAGFSKLPPKITRLEMTEVILQSESDLSGISSRLHSLAILRSDNESVTFTESLPLYLPTHLVELTLKGGAFVTNQFMQNLKQSLLNLEKLCIEPYKSITMSAIALKYLPDTLKELKTPVFPVPGDFDNSCLMNLPKQIERIEVSWVNPKATFLKPYSDDPPAETDLTNEFVKYLPRTLGYMNIPQSSRLTQEAAADLPARLFSLFAGSNSIKGVPTPPSNFLDTLLK